MPELPEVETIRRDLERGILHKKFNAIDILDGRVLRQEHTEFIRRLKGQRVERISRRGKALIIALSSGESLIVQVMMTGQMVLSKAPHKHTRIAFGLSDNIKLLYNDQRVFGQLRVVKNTDEIKYFRIIGPEPFDQAFNEQYTGQYFKKTSRPIKSVLLDHTFVAGVGNIYACEILHRSRLSPKRLAHRVKSSEIPSLLKQTREVLAEAIKLRGSSIRNYRDGAGQKGTFIKNIRVYAREGEQCLNCKAVIVRIVQSGRSTFYCMKCQR